MSFIPWLLFLVLKLQLDFITEHAIRCLAVVVATSLAMTLISVAAYLMLTCNDADC